MTSTRVESRIFIVLQYIHGPEAAEGVGGVRLGIRNHPGECGVHGGDRPRASGDHAADPTFRPRPRAPAGRIRSEGRSTPRTAETAVHISTDFWRWAGISTFRIRGVDEEMKKKDTP